jgi:heme-degrading monooxygenase HmoA
MYVILWEYQVKSNRIAEFEQIYNSHGVWAALFKKGKGYIGTELFRDEKLLKKYVTIDRWESIKDYEVFREQWKEEYEALDAQCEDLTETETPLGIWKTVNDETR